jgi:hypothetical protein
MVALGGALAKRTSFAPKPSVRSILCRTVAGGEVEGAVGRSEPSKGGDVWRRWRCSASSVPPGGTPTRGPDEYRRIVDILE